MVLEGDNQATSNTASTKKKHLFSNFYLFDERDPTRLNLVLQSGGYRLLSVKISAEDPRKSWTSFSGFRMNLHIMAVKRHRDLSNPLPPLEPVYNNGIFPSNDLRQAQPFTS